MNFKTFSFYVMIGVVVVLSVWLVFHIKTSEFKCLSDPYGYSIKMMEKANNNKLILCNCYMEGGLTFDWTDSSINVTSNQMKSEPLIMPNFKQ